MERNQPASPQKCFLLLPVLSAFGSASQLLSLKPQWWCQGRTWAASRTLSLLVTRTRTTATFGDDTTQVSERGRSIRFPSALLRRPVDLLVVNRGRSISSSNKVRPLTRTLQKALLHSSRGSGMSLTLHRAALPATTFDLPILSYPSEFQVTLKIKEWTTDFVYRIVLLHQCRIANWVYQDKLRDHTSNDKDPI